MTKIIFKNDRVKQQYSGHSDELEEYGF